jgi:hypothetical protein
VRNHAMLAQAGKLASKRHRGMLGQRVLREGGR